MDGDPGIVMPAEISTDVRRAAEILRSGGLVAFATETVYGLGADAGNPAAVARIFEVKGRPRFDPLIVHVADVDQARTLVTEFPEAAERLARAFWPGPLTLVLPKCEVVPDLVTAGLPTVALRVPAHEQALALIRAAGRPVAAPSANRFGCLSPTTAQHVQEQLGDRIDFILDGGPCRVGVESTILDLAGPVPRLLRPGGITVEELAPSLDGGIAVERGAVAPGEAAPAPGMLRHHYAPRTPLVLVEDWRQASADAKTAVLAFDQAPPGEFLRVEVLSPAGDLREAAARFFAALRRLDACGAERIIAVRFPSHGLGVALNDRLSRASADRE
jgi:L-threonylcarbamoyladenylate synthase